MDWADELRASVGPPYSALQAEARALDRAQIDGLRAKLGT